MNLQQYFQKSVEEYDNLVIAYSGGVDSQVLLYLASRTQKNILALHVNHNINEKSNDWAKFCSLSAEKCEKERNERAEKCIFLDFKEKSITLKNGNLENEARKERYKFFKEEYLKLKGKTALLTGHHMNDKAETFLLKLMRGSGLDGLSSIREKSNLFGMNVIRPLLKFKKEDLVSYAQENNLKWVEDPSNKSLEYDRNFMRREVIPLLESRWGKAVNSISKSAELVDEARIFSDSVIKTLYTKDENGQINTKELKELSYEVQKAIIRDWIKSEMELSPDSNLVNSVIEQCVNNKAHNGGKVMKKHFIIEKEKHLLRIKSI